MRATGIIRRVDDLGRVVIPKEIRRLCKIREGEPLEIYTDTFAGQPMVCFAKYETNLINDLTDLADAIDDEMMDAGMSQRNIVRNHFNEIAKILKNWEERG